MQEEIRRLQKEIEELQKINAELEYVKKEYAHKEKRKLLAKQNTMAEVIHNRERQLIEKNELLEQFQYEHRKQQKELKAYKEQLIALKGGSSHELFGSGTGTTKLELTEERKTGMVLSKFSSDKQIPNAEMKGIETHLMFNHLVKNKVHYCFRDHQTIVKS